MKESNSALSVFFFILLFFLVIGLFAFGVYLNKNQLTLQQFLTKNSEKIARFEQTIQTVSMETENNKNRIEEKSRKIMELEHSIDLFNNNLSETNRKIDRTNSSVNKFIKESKTLFGNFSKKIDDNNSSQNKKLSAQDKKLALLQDQLALIEAKMILDSAKKRDLSSDAAATVIIVKDVSGDRVATGDNDEIKKEIIIMREQLNNNTDGVMTRLVELESKIGGKADRTELTELQGKIPPPAAPAPAATASVTTTTVTTIAPSPAVAEKKETDKQPAPTVLDAHIKEYDRKIEILNKQITKIGTDLATINTYIDDLRKGSEETRSLSVRVDNLESGRGVKQPAANAKEETTIAPANVKNNSGKDNSQKESSDK